MRTDSELQRIYEEGERLRGETIRFLQQIDEANMEKITYCNCEHSSFLRDKDTGEVRCDHCNLRPDPHRLETIMPGVAKAALTAADPDALPVGARTEMEFVEELNPLCIWRFRDGSILKCRLVLMHAERVEGCFNPDGLPMYNLGWQQVLYVVAPDELKRPS